MSGHYANPADITLPSSANPGEPSAEHGRYRLLRLLGQGGMGRVYLAERTDGVHREQLALKLMQADASLHAELLQRFRTEREILARLHHPNIVPLLDGGEWSDGSPFLAMPFVDGISIQHWCEKHEATLEQRLRLMAKVCGAVHAAHQALVIHRDLKPSNILIDAAGEPQLLDFGIAKVLDDSRYLHSVVATRADAMLLTPRYASPEQVRGAPIGTATDVYALGVILYELVTEASPYPQHSSSGLSLLQAICTSEPVAPSRRSRDRPRHAGLPQLRHLGADLDAIILKALRKEPGERYPSADALREDLVRLLEGRPVAARSGSAWYALRKFARRHRWLLAASALSLCVLIYSAWTWRTQRDEVIRERDRANAVLAFMDRMLRQASPVLHGGKPPTVADMAAQAAERIDADAGLSMAAKAQLLTTLTGSIGAQGQFEQAQAIGLRAISAAEQAGPSHSHLLVGALLAYADVLVDAQDLPGMRGPTERALALIGEQDDPQSLAYRVFALRLQSRLAAFSEDYTESLRLADLQIALERERLGWPALSAVTPRGVEDEWSIGSALHQRCSALYNLGRLAAATTACGEAQRLREQIFPTSHPNHYTSLSTLSRLYGDIGRLADARAISLQFYQRDHQRFGPEHPESAVSAANLGFDELRHGRADAAVALLRVAERSMREKMGAQTERARRLRLLLAQALYFQGNPEGCSHYAELVEQMQHDAHSRPLVDALLGNAKCQLSTRQLVEAAATLERATAALQHKPDHTGKATLVHALLQARLAYLQGDSTRTAAALAQAEASLAQRRPQTFGESSLWLLRAETTADPEQRRHAEAQAAATVLHDGSRDLWTAALAQRLRVQWPAEDPADPADAAATAGRPGA